MTEMEKIRHWNYEGICAPYNQPVWTHEHNDDIVDIENFDRTEWVVTHWTGNDGFIIAETKSRAIAVAKAIEWMKKNP